MVVHVGLVAVLAVASACAVAELQPPARADITRVLYLNDCKPDGCLVYPGEDDARADSSPITDRQTFLDPFSHSDEVWASLVSCVEAVYAPFDLEITTLDPGAAPHFELMIAGYPQALGMTSGGGAALATCPNEVHDNALGFVFASNVPPETLCWAAAQESGHMLGLDHSLDPFDPMTWLAPPTSKPGFQDVDASCGESTARPCDCNLSKQNSHQLLMTILGPRQLFGR